MNARSRRCRRYSRPDGRAGAAHRRGAVHLVLILLLSLPFAWAGAQDSTEGTGTVCTEGRDPILWRTTGCSLPEEYLKMCSPHGKYVRKARVCMAWNKVKHCETVESVTDLSIRDDVMGFNERFPDSDFNRRAERCIERIEKLHHIAALLSTCREHVKEGRIFTGKWGNAVSCYREVLAQDPTNVEAKLETNKIRENLLNAADEALDEGKIHEAERPIDGLATINQEDPALRDLRDRLAELQEAERRQTEIAEARDALVKRIETLIGEDEFDEALGELQRWKSGEPWDKELASLEKAARDGRAKADQEKQEHEQTKQAEERARQAREKAMRDVRDALGERDFARARDRLDVAYDNGLPDREYRAKREEIALAEEQNNKRRALSELLAKCRELNTRGPAEDALRCYREVLELAPDHAEAKREVPILEMFVDWDQTDALRMVDAYYAFEQKHTEKTEKHGDLGQLARTLVSLARTKMNSEQDDYWESVTEQGTAGAYRDYLRIFPEGTYASEARQWLKENG